MGDFVAYSEDMAAGSEWLEHHGILGMHWGKLNGPPYPLGAGDHSSSEKSAAKSAGVKVGSDSGKGSIENVKKKKTRSKSVQKRELTPEEKRQQALDAAKSGDKKKIAKNIDSLTTEELRDAQARAQLKDQLTKKDPSEQKMSKADKEKQDAIRSGDKEKVKQYADKMSYQELSEAMNKIDLMQKLNYVPPEPTAFDKIRDVSQKLGTFKDAAEKGIAAYNTVAKVYNATHKDAQWPIVGEKSGGDKKEDKKEDKEKDQAKEAVKQVAKEIKKDYNEQLKDDIEKYKYEKRLAEAKKNIDEKEAKKQAKKEAKAEAKAAKEENKKTTITKDWEDSDLYKSISDVDVQKVSEDTYRAELEFLNSFKK